jgi:hypothetical protein
MEKVIMINAISLQKLDREMDAGNSIAEIISLIKF